MLELSDHDTVPSRDVLVELRRDVLRDVKYIWCLFCAIDGILLHARTHLGILPAFRHLPKVGMNRNVSSGEEPKVSIHDALPNGVVLLVEILRGVRRAVLLDATSPVLVGHHRWPPAACSRSCQSNA